MATYSPAELEQFFRTSAGGRTDITPAEMEAGGWNGQAREMYQQYMATHGGGAGAGGVSPQDLASIFRGPEVTLPDAEGAKGRLRDLQTSSISGLMALLEKDPQEGRAALRDAIYNSAAEPINYEADRATQRGLETMFGRNMGQSTVTGDEVYEPVTRARLAALARASDDAFVQANTLANQNTTTQAQVLGQAFNQGSAGLQGEAGVELGNASGQRQGTQAGYQTGIQVEENTKNRALDESKFGCALGQQAELQRESFANSQDIADKASTAASIGASVGGLAQFFAPTVNSALSRLFA